MTPTDEMIAMAERIAGATETPIGCQVWTTAYDAALNAVMEVGAWKPFKDAPRDGTKIDVWIGSDLGGYRVCNISFKNGFWRGVGRIEPYDFHRTPSHFMVAPDGPSATGSI